MLQVPYDMLGMVLIGFLKAMFEKGYRSPKIKISYFIQLPYTDHT